MGAHVRVPEDVEPVGGYTRMAGATHDLRLPSQWRNIVISLWLVLIHCHAEELKKGGRQTDKHRTFFFKL